MTTFYFIRHGKTEWNLQGRYQGANGNSPLLPESHHDIKLLAQYLRGTEFKHAYTSPLLRAQETATELIDQLEMPIPLTLDKRIAEVNLGDLEGMYYRDAQKQWPTVIDNFHYHADSYNEQIIHGESFPHVIERFKEAVRDYAHFNPTGNVLVVSHGAALNAGINGILGVPLAYLKDRGGLSNTSTTIVTTEDQGMTFELQQWNETSYLQRQFIDPTDTI